MSLDFIVADVGVKCCGPLIALSKRCKQRPRSDVEWNADVLSADVVLGQSVFRSRAILGQVILCAG